MRLAPRIKADLPATVEAKLLKSGAKITDLSINSAFVKGRFKAAQVGDAVLISYNLPQYGLFEYNGRAIRKDTAGMAITFPNLQVTTKTRLWKYITDNIKNLDNCPYCGEKYDIRPSVCKNCGWGLVFDSPDYFEYYEKMHLLKKLYSGAESLEADQIRRLINFLDVEILKRGMSEEFQEFVGTSAVMKEIFSKIRKVAPTEISVLILGESGTGKKLTALAIHERGARSNNALVPINCAAIPESLLEAELFGYERGAFTGAYTSKIGKFEEADGGTLFLDEIGGLSSNLQAKLLRFLEDQIVERIGATKGRKVNVRVIAATNCNIEFAVENGKFRKDLYYRLSTFPINLPPVRERGEDKEVLAKYFLKRFSREMGLPKEFTEDAITSIRNYSWPGNVREIINKVRKAIIMANDKLISPKDLDLNIQETILKTEDCLKDAREKIEKQKLREILGACDNNISRASKMVGISRPSLYSLKKK